MVLIPFIFLFYLIPANASAKRLMQIHTWTSGHWQTFKHIFVTVSRNVIYVRGNTLKVCRSCLRDSNEAKCKVTQPVNSERVYSRGHETPAGETPMGSRKASKLHTYTSIQPSLYVLLV